MPSFASIGVSLNLAKALHLARRGELREAEKTLVPSGARPADPLELHALAALVTSAGDFPRALELWRQLLQQEPRHTEARRMIAAIELWQSRPPWYRFIPAGAAVAGVILVAAVVLFVLSPSAPPELAPNISIVSAPVARAPLPAASAPDDRLRINFQAPSVTKKHRRQSVP